MDSSVDNADETGIRVDGKLKWAHVLCNGSTTSVVTTASMTCRLSVTLAFAMHSSLRGHLAHFEGMHPTSSNGHMCCAMGGTP